MLIESNTFRPMFKPWSPMSMGSWALLIFGIFAFLSFLGALVEDNRINWPPARKIRPPGILSKVIAVIGGIFGLYVAGYTGVLLAVTNRPIWSDTPLLGMLFVVSGASISAALMILVAHRSGWTMPGVAALHRIDAWVIALELIVLIAVMVSLGPVFRAWLNAWGLLLFFGVIVRRNADSLVALLAPAMARQSQRNHRCSLGFGRRLYSSASHRVLGARSLI